jgi:hypothetical protein
MSAMSELDIIMNGMNIECERFETEESFNKCLYENFGFKGF